MLLETDVDILINKTDDIKIDVSYLMNSYDALYIDIQNQQAQIDIIEGLISPGSDKFKELNVRLTKLEADAKSIMIDIDALQTE